MVIQNDIARDMDVITSKPNITSSCDSIVELVESDYESTESSRDETIESSCDEHVNIDEEINVSCDSLMKADAEVANLHITSHTWFEYTDDDSDDHVDSDDPTCDNHVGRSTKGVENLPMFIKVPPNKYDVVEADGGRMTLSIHPEYWDWFDPPSSCKENLNAGDGGTSSTSIVSGYGRDEGWDVDSKASSNSPRQSQDPKERVSCLSCGSDRITSDGSVGKVDVTRYTPSEESSYEGSFECSMVYDERSSQNYGDAILSPTSSEAPEWILESGDLESSSGFRYGDVVLNSMEHDEFYTAHREALRELVERLGLGMYLTIITNQLTNQTSNQPTN